MPIKYFTDRVQRAQVPSIDRVLARRKVLVANGSQNTASTALSTVISRNNDWQIDDIQFTFSNANSRTFGAYIKNGRKIVTDYNDYFWVLVNNYPYERIVLDAGFYSGTELAAHMKTKLDANTDFAAAGLTFTVTYDEAAGTFTIAPSTGTIKFISYNNATLRWLADSIAGCVIGFNNTSTSFASSIVSDTNVYGLNTEVAIVSQTASTATSYIRDTVNTMSLDQALHLTSNTGADVIVNYIVAYEDMV